MAPSIPNPNWPTLFAEGNFGLNPYYQQAGSSVYTDMTARLYRQWSIRRGKQFELDAVQPGEFHGQWVNQDGFLDPTNTTSFYTPGVVPFRGYRMRAQYPPSINLLTGDQATAGEVTPLAAGTSGNSVGLFGIHAFQVTASGTAWQGTNVWQATGTTSNGDTLFFTWPLPVAAALGNTYTFSIRVRSITTGANPVVNVGAAWINAAGSSIAQSNSGNTTLTGSPTATWTTLTFTATMPGLTAGTYPVAIEWFVQMPTSPGGTWSFQMDGLQMEPGSSASTFAIPGINYPVFSGLIERYPQSWDFNGVYEVVTPVCVDTMALLSQTILKEAYVMDVVATSPAWFFELNEPSGSTTFSEQAGRTPAAGIFTSAYGAGTLTPGSSIASATPGGTFYGTNGPVVTVNNLGAPSEGGTVIDLTPAGITGAPSSGGWTRMLALRTTNNVGNPFFAAFTTGYSPVSGIGPSYASTWYWNLVVTSGTNMTVNAVIHRDDGLSGSVTHTTVMNDNNWHLLAFSLSANGLTMSLYIDGVQVQATAAQDMHVSLSANDSLGGDEYKFYGWVGFGGTGFAGDVALYTQWNTELNASTVTSLYNSWKLGWQGDRSDQRYSRILGWAGYQGAQTLDTGTTVSMGPANDIAGQDALTCLQNVVNTETGRHFVGVDGAINFQSRTRMFQSVTPVWTFGENTAGGEIPYSDVAFDYDPTRISNAVAVTQTLGSITYTANDATSQAAYGVRNLSRNNQSTNGEEVREQAFFLLSRYKDPHLRIQALKINVAGNPALWASVLSFELGQHVRINRRDQFGVRPIITMDGFIEQITHTGDDVGNWITELQVSPTPSTAYSTFTSLRTTLFSGASSGQPVITISALPDAATNAVRSELTGGQILLITGGGNSESVTIATGGVQNQAAGYTSAQITLTANLAHTYSAGATVVEATGANYDTLGVFDTTQFSY